MLFTTLQNRVPQNSTVDTTVNKQGFVLFDLIVTSADASTNELQTEMNADEVYSYQTSLQVKGLIVIIA